MRRFSGRSLPGSTTRFGIGHPRVSWGVEMAAGGDLSIRGCRSDHRKAYHNFTPWWVNLAIIIL